MFWQSLRLWLHWNCLNPEKRSLRLRLIKVASTEPMTNRRLHIYFVLLLTCLRLFNLDNGFALKPDVGGVKSHIVSVVWATVCLTNIPCNISTGQWNTSIKSIVQKGAYDVHSSILFLVPVVVLTASGKSNVFVVLTNILRWFCYSRITIGTSERV